MLLHDYPHLSDHQNTACRQDASSLINDSLLKHFGAVIANWDCAVQTQNLRALPAPESFQSKHCSLNTQQEIAHGYQLSARNQRTHVLKVVLLICKDFFLFRQDVAIFDGVLLCFQGWN